MRYIEKQRKIEQKTYDIINEISNELDLEIRFYPEVYWIGRKLSFEDLGIKNHRNGFNKVKQEKGGIYIPNKEMILIGGDNDYIIAEEAGHFLHYTNSKINIDKLEKKNDLDLFAFNNLAEALGYFCSKLIDSSRKPLYQDYANFREFAYKLSNNNKTIENIILEDQELRSEFLLYKEAYDLGESLFNYYISDLIKASQIKDLMLCSFEENYSATKKFLELKQVFVEKDKA